MITVELGRSSSAVTPEFRRGTRSRLRLCLRKCSAATTSKHSSTSNTIAASTPLESLSSELSFARPSVLAARIVVTVVCLPSVRPNELQTTSSSGGALVSSAVVEVVALAVVGLVDDVVVVVTMVVEVEDVTVELEADDELVVAVLVVVLEVEVAECNIMSS